MSILLSEGDLARLEELKRAPNDDWCRGVWAASLLYAFNQGDEAAQDAFVNANWRRLAGRRCEDVRRLAGEMKKAKPEQWQLMLSAFGKTHDPIRRAA